jgi:hypothetical protein
LLCTLARIAVAFVEDFDRVAIGRSRVALMFQSPGAQAA